MVEDVITFRAITPEQLAPVGSATSRMEVVQGALGLRNGIMNLKTQQRVIVGNEAICGALPALGGSPREL